MSDMPISKTIETNNIKKGYKNERGVGLLIFIFYYASPFESYNGFVVPIILLS